MPVDGYLRCSLYSKATISIANDDSDENPYTFTIQGTGTGIDSPEIAVKNDSGVLIPDNDTSPSAADGTDFSSVDALSGSGPAGWATLLRVRVIISDAPSNQVKSRSMTILSSLKMP